MIPISESLDIGYRAGVLPFPGEPVDVGPTPNEAEQIDRLGQLAKAYLILETWHRDNHPGPFNLCHTQPCHAVTVGVWG